MIISEVRKQKKVKVMDLATRLGISQGHYSNLERGKRSWNDELVTKLAAVLDIPKELVLEAVNSTQVETGRLKSWLSTMRINRLPFIKAFRYYLESKDMNVSMMDNADLKKELRQFVGSNIDYSILVELSENKQLLDQIRSKLHDESVMKKENEKHEQPGEAKQ